MNASIQITSPKKPTVNPLAVYARAHPPHPAAAAGVAVPRVARAEALALAAVLLVVSASAVITKELTARSGSPALAMVEGIAGTPSSGPVGQIQVDDPLADRDVAEVGAPANEGPARLGAGLHADTSLRWFNGRPARPAKTIWMTVTAYSPDSRSCGDSADGITASLHAVETNAHKLVAADTRILPLGSMISIPGYDSDRIVPVLDRGGAIKGRRLDVLFPTHEAARKWGVKKLPVTVWEYADGKPPESWRRIRDSRN